MISKIGYIFIGFALGFVVSPADKGVLLMILSIILGLVGLYFVVSAHDKKPKKENEETCKKNAQKAKNGKYCSPRSKVNLFLEICRKKILTCPDPSGQVRIFAPLEDAADFNMAV